MALDQKEGCIVAPLHADLRAAGTANCIQAGGPTCLPSILTVTWNGHSRLGPASAWGLVLLLLFFFFSGLSDIYGDLFCPLMTSQAEDLFDGLVEAKLATGQGFHTPPAMSVWR